MRLLWMACWLAITVAACAQASTASAQASTASAEGKAVVASGADGLPADQVEAVVRTALGEFRFQFAAAEAPEHVRQFMQRAREGYYDGSAFFRVVLNGLIQGGDPLLKDPKTPRKLWGTGGLKLLKSAFSDLKHERGVVSTVRIPGQPDSDGAQFFVCVSPQPALDGQFSVFGRVTEGMDVVEKISQVAQAADGFTEEPVRIEQVRIQKRRVAVFADAAVDALRRTVTMETTLGKLRIQTAPEWAPEHARQFLNLVAEGWYDGVAFHRIVPGFVVQGGMGYYREPSKTHRADRWVRALPGEFRDEVKHVKGVVSMARDDDPDSATTSFFLMLGDGAYLDGKYSAFARVVEGLETLDAFEREEVDGETPKRRLEIVRAILDPQ
ncbi:MAG: peptidylprolyl isomerase [Bryobacterales bacterium]|jgi:cyclophilin family peptidyl-prolyl cis-trans isomerase|nr:peptidylprolyl isomerase [Bryobacterales bacterium]